MRKLVSWPLLLALAASLLAHLLLVVGANFSLPDWTEEDEPIQVSLVSPPAPPARTTPSPKPPSPARPAKVEAKPSPPPKQVEQPTSAPQPTEPQPVAAQESSRVEPQPVPEPEMPAAPPVEESPAAVQPSPKRVEIGYQILRGSGGGSVGKVRRSFHLVGENRYVLDSVAEATGLVSLFYSGKYEEHSEGVVTARGLQPNNYRLKRGSGKAQSAMFDWEAHSVTLDSGSNHATVQIPDGTQDMLSFLYQFMFVAPLEDMLITVANGKKLKTYAYSFEGEEPVETRMGKLQAWHISKTNADNDDKMEFWLASDYRFLPVRIRQTERDGTVTELLATSLSME